MRRSKYPYVPEASLEPPEDRRQVVAECACCGEEIREGDDCYDICIGLSHGYVCVRCIENALIHEIEAD